MGTGLKTENIVSSTDVPSLELGSRVGRLGISLERLCLGAVENEVDTWRDDENPTVHRIRSNALIQEDM